MKKNELILSVRDLNIKFNLRGKILHAIRGIDLDVYHGEVLAIVGESGSGKSVFTKSFMGLLDSNGSITSGTIDYFGADDHQPIRLSDLKKEKDWLKVRGHEIAMIMQDPMTSLNPLKTIGDQIMEPWSSIRASRALPPGRRPSSTCGMSASPTLKCASSSIPTSSRAVCASASSSPLP